MIKDLKNADKPQSWPNVVQNQGKSFTDGLNDKNPQISHQIEESKKKMKELKQKHKLEIEIKENQVRSLKMKIE